MTVSLAGRGVAMIGIILGLLAVALDFASGGTSSYLDSGAVAVFAIALLSMASYLPAEVGFDTAGTAAGVAVFGFYLSFPAIFAFNHLGELGAGAWLGLGTVLIPIGRSIVRRAEGAHEEQPAAISPAAAARNPLLALAVAGVILMAAGIWLPIATDGGPSYWNASPSSHLLGILLLLAVLANATTLVVAPLVWRVHVSADRVLLVACASFGIAVAFWLDAFNHLGGLGTGGWLEAIGGLLLLGGVVAIRLTAARGAQAPAALAATP
jgi:hypothetical protein